MSFRKEYRDRNESVENYSISNKRKTHIEILEAYPSRRN